jgi:hypothetical protein
MCADSVRDSIVILLVWMAVVTIVNPIGNFPLSDDWSYGRAVHSLIEHGQLEFVPGWTSQTLIAQVLWGALFCLPFGFSFNALRLSTLILASLGLFATYTILREVQATRRLAVYGTIMIAVNPLYLCLANTFMTDVPFFSLAMISVLFFIRTLKHSRKSDVCIATVFAVLAALVRQIGVFLPIAFAAACIYTHGSIKKTRFSEYAPAIAAIASVAIYLTYLRQMHGLPASFEGSSLVVFEKLIAEPMGALNNFVRAGIKSTLYWGVFLLPLILLFSRRLTHFRQRESLFSSAGFLVLAGFLTTCVVMGGRLMPMMTDIIYNLSLGPPTLRDTYLLDLPHLPTAPQGFWLIVTGAGILGGSAGLTLTLQTTWKLLRKKMDIETRTKAAITLFVAIAAALYFLPLSLLGFRDRYLLFCLPLLMLLLVNGNPAIGAHEFRWTKGLAAGILILLGLFAVGGTHDYLNWNRTRWKALRELTEQKGVPPCRIDGGFEFNGWYCYDENYSEVTAKSWWWVKDDDYVIAFGEIPGFVEEKEFAYTRWIPPGGGHILVLKKATSPDIATCSAE